MSKQQPDSAGQFFIWVMAAFALAVILGCLGLFGHPYIWNVL